MIRKLTFDDKDLFLSLSEKFYASEAVLHDIPKERHLCLFEELMRSDVYTECFLLCEGERPLGYALIAKTFSRESGGTVIWIEEIYLLPEGRGKGLGTEFFRFAESLGATRLRLEVEPNNERAIALYERLGFRPLPYLQYVKRN